MARRVRELADAHGLEARILGLDDPTALRRALAGIRVVLHAAGPFSRTSRPMADACLLTGAHYLDITGEIGVFEALAARDDEARAAGVMLLPGVGFDVVPSDCLAAHLKRRLPAAVRLTLAFQVHGRALPGHRDYDGRECRAAAARFGGAARSLRYRRLEDDPG